MFVLPIYPENSILLSQQNIFAFHLLERFHVPQEYMGSNNHYKMSSYFNFKKNNSRKFICKDARKNTHTK